MAAAGAAWTEITKKMAMRSDKNARFRLDGFIVCPPLDRLKSNGQRHTIQRIIIRRRQLSSQFFWAMFRYFFEGQRLPTLTNSFSGELQYPFSTVDGGRTVIGEKGPSESNNLPAGPAVQRRGDLRPQGP
jgi:hypothetical protein